MQAMRAYDLSPLLRSSIGFDRLGQVFDAAFKLDERTSAYPPYNIVKTGEDSYQIVMAVAGFAQDELNIVFQENMLTVTGNHTEETPAGEYLHKGIATRNFERKFSLADHVKVVNAELADGLLTLSLTREIPEESKPRAVPISIGADAKTRKTIKQ